MATEELRLCISHNWGGERGIKVARIAGANTGRQTVGILEYRQEHTMTQIPKIAGLLREWGQGIIKGAMCYARELRIYP